MTENKNPPSLPGGKRIARNTFWNIIGFCAPVLVAIFCIPPMIRGLGKDQFGLLSLVWMLVGYFTIFDMGIGRALTRIAAERIGQGREKDLPGLFWTSCMIMFALGIVAAVIVVIISPWLTSSALNIPVEMQPQTLRSFQLVAISLPVVVMTAGMIGFLEARQRFGLINLIRVPLGSFTFIGPLLVLPFSNSLFPVVLILIAGRSVEWLSYFIMCLRETPELLHGFRWNSQEVKPLMSTGGWITVSTLLMPFMVHIDRFLIGSILTVGIVTYYATASEIVVKLLIFPRAWVSVLFPTFAAHFGQRQDQTSDLFARSLSWLMAMLLPVILVVIALTPEGFRIWLGDDFAIQSTPVMRLLTTGIFIYCLTYIPFSFLQGIGRPDIPARIHLVEFPFFVVLAIYMIKQLGINGAAMSWVIRAILEFAVMLCFCRKFAPVTNLYAIRWAICLLTSLIMIITIVLCDPLLWRIITTAVSTIVWTGLVWLYLFDAADRSELLNRLKKLQEKQ